MALSEPDYTRLNSDKHLAFYIAPTSDATGVQVIGAPTEAELVVEGASGFLNASPTVSWNDYDFGMEDSERTSDPSLADDSNYEDYGQENYGGGVSFYMPDEYDDNSNNHSLVYDMTDELHTRLDVVTRLDGAKDNVRTPIQDGDYVSVYRTITGSDEDSDTGSDSIRRTVGFMSQGRVAPYTIVGDHTDMDVTLGDDPWAEGAKGRIMVSIEDRDYTNALNFTTSDPSVIRVYPGGFYEVIGTADDTASIIIEDRMADTSTTEAVTVTA